MADKNRRQVYDEESNNLLQNLHSFLEIHKKVKPKSVTLKIIFIYFIFGCLWILLSDTILGKVAKDPELFKEIQLYKGWIYVILSSAVFYLIIVKKLKLFKSAIDKIFEGYKELSEAHEELMVMDEELSEQYEELELQRNDLVISDQRYQLAVEGANDGIWDWDLKTNGYFFSLKTKRVFGYEPNELEDTNEQWKKLLHPNDTDRVMKVVQDYLESKTGIYENTYRIRCKNGQYRWILSRGKCVWDIDGRPLRFAGSHTDITDHIEMQEHLRSEKELSDAIINQAPMIILILDVKGNIIQFNPFAESVTGYKQEEVLGKNATQLLSPELKNENLQELFKNIINGESLYNNEIETRCKDGHSVLILWNNNLLHDTKGNIQGVVSMGMDITQRRKMENELYSLAYHDSLTRMPNREMLKEMAEKQFQYAKDNNKKSAFIYLDIDNFKHINDTMGHSTGDKLIVHIANILLEQIKAPHSVARLGGDEFAIILADIENAENITSKLEDLHESIRKPWTFEGKDFHVSLSIGVAIYPEHGTDLETLMQNADTAMFHIKENGKDGYSFFNFNMREKALYYIQMKNQLINAMNNQEFQLYYQPQINLLTGEIVGVEALIRWMPPGKDCIPPIEFIPFAEKTGYICHIDEWVIKSACCQKREWKKLGFPNLIMSINLSGVKLMQDGLVLFMQKVLEDNNLDGSNIVIEITETAVMNDLDKAIEVLVEFKKLGITIALDDFGTGYSSLTYLQKLPIDILKIDREFVRNIINTDDESYIFKSIVELAHNMGLEVLAEGVETKEQEGFILKNSCDVGQGYYFSKPITSMEIERLIKNKQAVMAE